MAISYDAPSASDNFLNAVRLTTKSRRQYPFQQDLSAVLYLENYVQRPDRWEPLPLGSLHPDLGNDITTESGDNLVTDPSENQLITEPSPAYLVEESNPTLRNDGLFRWTRTYATVPATRVEYGTGVFNFPAYKTNTASILTLRDNFSQSAVTKMTFSYLNTTDAGADLTITDKFQPVDSGSNKVNFVASDSSPTLVVYQGYVTAGTYIQARETEVSRWMGNIWQSINVEVIAI